jgi:hypothetical protein
MEAGDDAVAVRSRRFLAACLPASARCQPGRRWRRIERETRQTLPPRPEIVVALRPARGAVHRPHAAHRWRGERRAIELTCSVLTFFLRDPHSRWDMVHLSNSHHMCVGPDLLRCPRPALVHPVQSSRLHDIQRSFIQSSLHGFMTMNFSAWCDSGGPRQKFEWVQKLSGV